MPTENRPPEAVPPTGDRTRCEVPSQPDAPLPCSPDGCPQTRGGTGGDAAPAVAANQDTSEQDTTCQDAPPRTVALDIETTGLDRFRDSITVVCLYGHLSADGPPSALTFNLLAGHSWNKAQALADVLDAAPRIACFNGTRFDIPFLQQGLGFAPERVGAWVLKMFDVFDIAQTILRTTFRLDVVLALNGMPTKSASGLQAIEWARRPADWPLLEAYCLEDTRLTFELSQLPRIRLPAPQRDGSAYHIVQEGPRFRLELHAGGTGDSVRDRVE